MAQELAPSDHIYVDEFYFSLLFDENLDHNDPISDDKYAEALQLQEALMSSIITSERANVTIQANITSQTESVTIKKTAAVGQSSGGQSSQEFCEICVEKKESEDMFTIPTCSHSFCLDCISKYLATCLQDNIIQVTCPAWKCQGTLQLDSCRSLLPKAVVERWEDALCESMILASQRLYCPFKDCSAMFVIENEHEEVTESECPFCHRLFCARCNVAWHAGVDCEEFGKMKEDERGWEDLQLMELVKKKHWMRCPKCKFFVERTAGCPHITCRCKFEFCYGCGREWIKGCGGCREEDN